MTTPDAVRDVNPYAPPAAESLAEHGERVGEISPDEVTAFVVSNDRYYRRSWAQLMHGRRSGLLAGFNKAAFFLSLFWLLYRKMYKEFFLFAGPGLVIGILTQMIPVDPSLDRTIDHVINIAVASTVGTLGNGLYFRRARRVIEQARREEPDRAKRISYLRRRGGTTMIGPLVLLFVIVGSIALAGLER